MDSQKDKLKLEKLSAAVYMVTNFLPDSEPVKWRLRDISLSILSHLTVPNNYLGHLVSPIEQILSLINIARLNPGVSQMNFDILRQEYVALRDRLLSSASQDLLASAPVIEPVILNPDSRPQAVQSGRTPKLGSGAAMARVPNGRRDLIYRIIKQQGPISIKDIARAVPGVSSKTVQRELSDLVRAGQLRREGERRWSRYSAV